MLAGHGATVIMACRNAARAQTAADRIRDTAPGTRVRTVPDLASLVSLREAAARLRAEYPRLDLLVNNAGGINPRYCRTGDGIETTWPPTTSARSRSPAWFWTCCWHQRKANHDHQAIRLDRHGAG